jgi:hypothetical protein
MLPRPGLFIPRYWSSRVTIPAKIGVETEVPPKIEPYVLIESATPFAHELAVLLPPTSSN